MVKENFMIRFNFYLNLFFVFIFLFGGLIWADSNGVWTLAEDIREGTFGSDELSDPSGFGFRFLSQVLFEDSVVLSYNKSCDSLDSDLNGKIICGVDNIGQDFLDDLSNNQISDLLDVSEIGCMDGQVLKTIAGNWSCQDDQISSNSFGIDTSTCYEKTSSAWGYTLTECNSGDVMVGMYCSSRYDSGCQYYKIKCCSVGTVDSALNNPVKAWVNFNGNDVSIRNSFNVASVSKLAVGRYRINFQNPMPDINYVVSWDSKYNLGNENPLIENLDVNYVDVRIGVDTSGSEFRDTTIGTLIVIDN